MTRKSVTLLGFVALLGIIVIIASRRGRSRTEITSQGSNEATIGAVSISANGATVATNGSVVASKAARAMMSDNERLQWLEKLGQVPDDADLREWQLAQRTSWWGRPLDPKEFWKGRTIWLDGNARLAARKRGRSYPPIPYDNPAIPRTKNDDKDVNTAGLWDVEGPNLKFHATNHETRFWDNFQKTKPKPPGELESQQFQLAERILTRRFAFEQGDLTGETAKSLADAEARDRAIAQELGGPAEAFSDDALYWSYVMRKLQEHQELVNGNHPTNSAAFKSFFFRLPVEPKRVMTPPTASERGSANEWKKIYLRRLRNEKVDESYLNAYMQAWNLLPADVFAQQQRP